MKLLQKLTMIFKGGKLPDEKRPDDITSKSEGTMHGACAIDGKCCGGSNQGCCGMEQCDCK
ncbi:MAG: hypothetical protein AAB839_00660 [Patescibacteria group bacterium]